MLVLQQIQSLKTVGSIPLQIMMNPIPKLPPIPLQSITQFNVCSAILCLKSGFMTEKIHAINMMLVMSWHEALRGDLGDLFETLIDVIVSHLHSYKTTLFVPMEKLLECSKEKIFSREKGIGDIELEFIYAIAVFFRNVLFNKDVKNWLTSHSKFVNIIIPQLVCFSHFPRDIQSCASTRRDSDNPEELIKYTYTKSMSSQPPDPSFSSCLEHRRNAMLIISNIALSVNPPHSSVNTIRIVFETCFDFTSQPGYYCDLAM